MKKASLLTVKRLRESIELEARREYSEALAELNAQRDRLAELESYLDACAQSDSKGIVSASEFSARRDFMGSIKDAILSQKEVLFRYQQRVNEKSIEHMTAKKQLRAVEILIDKENSRSAREDERKEQLLIDEWSSTRRS